MEDIPTYKDVEKDPDAKQERYGMDIQDKGKSSPISLVEEVPSASKVEGTGFLNREQSKNCSFTRHIFSRKIFLTRGQKLIDRTIWENSTVFLRRRMKYFDSICLFSQSQHYPV